MLHHWQHNVINVVCVSYNKFFIILLLTNILTYKITVKTKRDLPVTWWRKESEEGSRKKEGRKEKRVPWMDGVKYSCLHYTWGDSGIHVTTFFYCKMECNSVDMFSSSLFSCTYKSKTVIRIHENKSQVYSCLNHTHSETRECKCVHIKYSSICPNTFPEKVKANTSTNIKFRLQKIPIVDKSIY